MSEWHPDEDQLVELALLTLDADQQELLSAHLVGCAACRGEYTAIDDGVQRALAAGPSLAPPAGFSGRVLAAMATFEPRGATAGAEPGSRRPALRRTLLLVAAAAVVGILAGVGITLASLAPPWSAPAAAGGAAATLTTGEGETVGTAGLATLAGRRYLTITVTRARPGAHYECIVVGPDGGRRSAGSWTLHSEYGGGVASGTWLVEAPPQEVVRVELVAPSGKVWSQAQF